MDVGLSLWFVELPWAMTVISIDEFFHLRSMILSVAFVVVFRRFLNAHVVVMLRRARFVVVLRLVESPF